MPGEIEITICISEFEAHGRTLREAVRQWGNEIMGSSFSILPSARLDYSRGISRSIYSELEIIEVLSAFGDPLAQPPRTPEEKAQVSPLVAMQDGFDGPAGEERARQYLRRKGGAALRMSLRGGEMSGKKPRTNAEIEDLVKKLGLE
ncbi:MAG: hypothetical protein JWQ04_2777 [Pedosphaera sp.]|nr:hypothetical protein [Pedosphaera sp.]